MFLPSNEELTPVTFKAVLLDDLAQTHSEQLSHVENLEIVPLTAISDEIETTALFLIGDFDKTSTQQAVQNLPKSANTFYMAIQLGKEKGQWADSTVLLREGQTAFNVVSTITQLAAESDDDFAIHVEWIDIQQMCQGLHCQLISSDLFDGENRAENAAKQLAAKLPENIAGIACLIRADKDFGIDEFMISQDNLFNNVNGDAMIIIGLYLAQSMNGKLSLTALVSFA